MSAAIICKLFSNYPFLVDTKRQKKYNYYEIIFLERRCRGAKNRVQEDSSGYYVF